MTRVLALAAILFSTAAARGEAPLYRRADPQPAAQWAYAQYPSTLGNIGAYAAPPADVVVAAAYPYGGYAPYGYRSGYGSSWYRRPYGYGGFGYGFGYGGAVGYYPPNPFGNPTWIAPNPPSPYYVVPSTAEYREQVRRRDEAIYTEMILRQRSVQPTEY